MGSWWLGLWNILSAVFSMLLDVTQFWKDKLLSWLHSKSPRDRLFHTLANAQSYEEWEEAAFELDELLSKDLWRQNPVSRHYDYRLILGRLESLMGARESEDILTLVNLLRSGVVRNLGNITSTKLFTHAYAGTKLLIDDYITQVALSIQYVASMQPAPIHPGGFTSQAKLELLHDTRQAFGRTTLLLQGGSAFGLCHLGVVKALHLQGLLPRIITGTATGAMIAALVGIHSEDELLPLLDGAGIDLSAFERRKKGLGGDGSVNGESWFGTFYRRMKRLVQKGYLFDVGVLEECVRANVGDLTFEEAYARSKRILNITVATTGKNGTPNLLNYLTAPNVLIWSAAVASNASPSTALYSPVTIYCKDETGTITPWPHTRDAIFQPWRHVHYNEGESPLSRISELFNVNHFIVSQARPYLVPFLRSELNLLDRRQTGWNNLSRSAMRLIIVELRHRLRQLDYLGILPASVSRLVIDETIPGPNLTLVPDLCFWDLRKLFQSPTRERVAEWTLKGERGVWPAVSALKVREAVEIELDRGYQLVRRRRPSDASLLVSVPRQTNVMNEGVPRRRRGGSENEEGILADRE